eukprot:SAG11_NODE_3224_length_2600_cov_3.746901_5_plen_38_part_00
MPEYNLRTTDRRMAQALDMAKADSYVARWYDLMVLGR